MRILLVSGWGMPAAVLSPLRVALGVAPEHYYVFDRPLAELRRRIAADIQPGAVLIGWSLGGALALDLAREFRSKTTAVVTIATNPRFLSATDWPNGYDPGTFKKFEQGLGANSTVTLERFAALTALGSGHQQEELRWLRGQMKQEVGVQQDVLRESLAALAGYDLRSAWRELDLPVLSLLGQRDALVPSAVADDLIAVGASSEGARVVKVISGMAHLPSYRFAEPAAEAIREFVLPIVRSWC